MRSVLLIILGLFMGILSTAYTFSVLHQHTPVSRAVMSLMGYHMSRVQHMLKAQRCDVAAITTDLSRLQLVALDIPDAFKGAEQLFLDSADKLQDALRDATANATCAGLPTAIKVVDDACEDCHKQYR